MKETAEVQVEAKPERAKDINWHKIGYQILKDNMLNVRPSDIDELEAAAAEWWNDPATKESWYGKTLHQVLSHWSVKTLMLVGKIFADNWFYNFINRVDEGEDDPGDEDDDD